MGIKMSGLVSGLDTDSIIKELMSAHSLKKTKVENKQTKLEWKQEKWQDLNSKIYALYTGTLSKMKTQGSYQAKKATSSNETKVTVTASSSAVEGAHKVKVNQVASAQHVTSGKVSLKDSNGDDVKISSATKLTELGMTANNTINFSSDKKSYSLDISADTTVGDFVEACKQAGLTASFDSGQGRFFISSDSGADNAFSITTTLSTDTDEKNALRDALGYGSLSTSQRVEADKLINAYPSATADEKVEIKDKLYEKAYEKASADYKASLLEQYKNKTLDLTSDAGKALKEAADKAEADYMASLDSNIIDPTVLDKAINTALNTAATKHVKEVKEAYIKDPTTASAGNPFADAVTDVDNLLVAYESAKATSTSSNVAGEMEKIGLTNITYTKNQTTGDLSYTYDATTSGVSVTGAANSKIEFNGAKLESSTNTITANGLTFTVNEVTDPNETINLSVSKDVDSMYETIKSFVKEYNALLEELNENYNAKTARGYEPLTDDERDAMTDDQIEKWETKIKDSLLRRDTTLSGVISTLRDSVVGSVTYNGKSYSLSSFGITSKDFTEKGKLHIAGDADDSLTSGDKDKLKKALEEDPEAVMTVFTELSQKLYDNLTDKMKSSSLSSALTFYNDKQISKDLTSYKTDLKKLETKLKDIEDRYYKQFAAMEKAMSSLNSQSSSLSSMLGMG